MRQHHTGYKQRICKHHQVFCKFLNFFFKNLLSFDEVTAEISPNFYSDLLQNFLASFQSVFKFSFDTQIILFINQ